VLAIVTCDQQLPINLLNHATLDPVLAMRFAATLRSVQIEDQAKIRYWKGPKTVVTANANARVQHPQALKSVIQYVSMSGAP
jgi:hypothetical protein